MGRRGGEPARRRKGRTGNISDAGPGSVPLYSYGPRWASGCSHPRDAGSGYAESNFSCPRDASRMNVMLRRLGRTSALRGAWLRTSLPAAAMRRRIMEVAMDGSTFDRLARLAATTPARRSLLKSGFAAALAGLGVASLLGVDDAEAKSC